MTTPVKRSPLVELDGMERWLNTMLAGIGFGPIVRPLIPAADVYVSAGEYVIELEVPGFREMELGIEISSRMLTVTGKHVETVDETKTFRLHERLASEFERTFVLPPDVDVENITSTFANGVLKVVAPIPTAPAPRTVPITTG
jgi:HSP20 family protein